jgi:EAL domain-containing protein (putative c-di-GMP-specific phosphodiesterase class I)
MRDYGIDPRQFEIEVTESLMMKEDDAVRARII